MTKRRRINALHAISAMLIAALIVACSSETDRWAKATQTDTADAYSDFLTKFPAGVHRAEAAERLEDRRWTEVQAADSLDALNQYIKEYPNGKFVAGARQAVKDYSKSDLQRATRKGDLSAMRALLDRGTPVNPVEGVSTSALHMAADTCNQAAIDLLLARHADVNVRASDDTTPLHAAVSTGCMPAVRRLLEGGADPNLLVREGMQGYVAMGDGKMRLFGRGGHPRLLGTPLHWAAAGHRLEIAAYLIEHRADVNAMTTRWIAPLHYAAESGSVPMVELLLNRGASTHYEPDPTDTSARYADEPKIVPNGQAIHYAKTGAMVALLVAKGARLDEPSEYRGQPLHSLTALGYTDAVTYLLDHKVPVDGVGPWNIDAGRTTNATPLWIAATAGRLDLIKLFEKRGGKLGFVASDTTGKFGGSLLHAAAWGGHAEVVSYLLAKGLPVDARADMPTMFPLAAAFENITPLGIAAHNGHVAAMAALVKAGADMNAKSGQDWTPTRLAVAGQQLEAVTFLLDRGVAVPYPANIIDRLNSSDEVKKLFKERLARNTRPAKPTN
jgi:ankyrin repeat protein